MLLDNTCEPIFYKGQLTLEVKGHGESDGVPLTVVVTGFEAQKGRFFALLGVGSADSSKKYSRNYEALAASIEPLQASAGKAAIAAVGTNAGDPYQHRKEGELKFVRGKQSGPPE